MQKFLTLLVILCACSNIAKSQGNITRVEYFFNSDPGFGKGKVIPISPAANIENSAYPIPVDAIPTGLQNLFIRSASSNNVWSITNHLLFYKTTLATPPNIMAAEYFVDKDPGFGSATSVALSTSAADLSNISIPIDISVKGAGIHTLFLRSKDSNGRWSLAAYFMFLKLNASALTNIIKAEYFVDNDPGFDRAQAVGQPINGTNAADLTETVKLDTVSEGLHNLYLRTKNASNTWSITNQYLFYKSAQQISNVADAEYFIDNDPGFGNANKLPSFTPSANIADVNYSIDLSTLDSGIHRLYIRTRSVNNKWSITNYLQFRKTIALPLTLISFDAVALNKQAMLTWQTNNEHNTSHFDVEYGIDGEKFLKLASVVARGNTASNFTYSFVHTSPLLNGDNYYRLKEVDVDGKFSYSPIRTLTFLPGEKFAVFPNPVHTNLTIYTAEKGLTIHLFDGTGRALESRMLTDYTTSINVTGIPSGIYYLVAEKNGSPVHTQKIFKQ